MNIEVLPLGPYEANCCIIWNDQRCALVIDPGSDGKYLARAISHAGLKVCGFLLTHGHADHVCGLAAALKEHPAPVYIHEEDARWLFSDHNQIPPYYARPEDPRCELKTFAGNGTLEIGPFRLRTIHTPGHSPGSSCYYFPEDRIIFTGDTLFKGSAGRTDLRGGDSRALAESLKVLAALPEQTTVYPGHGDQTDIAKEKAANYFLRSFTGRD